MRVVAFSCAHWMSRKVQEEIFEYEPLSYAPFLRLCKKLLENPPDVVIDLGDLAELVYEDLPLPREYTNLQGGDVELIKLRGNHDPGDGEEFVVIDGVRYEHGQKLGTVLSGTREEYMKSVRIATVGMKLVHGHTHIPSETSELPLDVGSVTFSRTYGEIIDGRAELKYV